MFNYRNWSIRSKIISITLITVIAMLVGLFAYILPYLKRNLLHEKEAATRHIVELAMGVLESYEQEVKSGSIDTEEAQQLASKRIATLRYEAIEYLWINDLGSPIPTMIMHPTVPALNGKLLDDPKFNKATYMRDGTDGAEKKLSAMNLFSAFAEVAQRSGHGFVIYEWPKAKPGGGTTSELYPKLSYVKQFAPWGWVLGSGIYIDDVDNQVRQMMWIMLGGTFGLALFAIVLAFFVGRGVVLPLEQMQETLEKMASGEGDLTSRLAVVQEDETGALASVFNRFLGNLHGIISQVRDSSHEVGTRTDIMQSATVQIVTSSTDVGGHATSVATAVEEVAATSHSIAESCIQAYENANQACSTAQSGATVVHAAVASISAIADRVQESARTVESLGSRSDQIGQIIGTIEDIADQTNLLALNAAIEAARAGEMGRGFAVVADEVRALAERTTRATREIADMIKVIQQETANAVSSMEAGVVAVEQGTGEAARSGEALEEILAQVSGLTDQINQIATAAEEQTAATNDISHNMQRIVGEAEQTMAGARNAGSEADELHRITERLNLLVGRFRL